MAIIPVEVYAEISGLSVTVPGWAATVGLSVDEPLPSKISGTKYVIGEIPLYVFAVQAKFGPTTFLVNAGPGNHYVILGIEMPPAVVTAVAFRLRLSAAGVVNDTEIPVLEANKYIYVAFEVRQDGTVAPLSYGTVAPGGSPIASPGGGSLFSGDPTFAMTEMMGVIMEMMIPLMMMSMMMQMMAGLIQGLSTAFTGVI